MKRLFVLAFSILLADGVATTASAASATAAGAPALALAAIVGDHSPLLSSGDRHLLLHIFDGNLSFVYPANQKISVAADSVICRTSNVDISARSCKLTFGTHVRNLKGRKANELNATAIQAGVPSDGAAGNDVP